MTVAELIDELKKQPQDSIVVYRNWAKGSIWCVSYCDKNAPNRTFGLVDYVGPVNVKRVGK